MPIIENSISRAADKKYISLNGVGYATIQAAMDAIVASGQIIVIGPGTYTESVTWTNYKECAIVAAIPGTAVIEAAATFAVKMDPHVTDSKTWTGTLQGVGLSHADTFVGLQIDNHNVGARMNIMLYDVDIESETAADHAIDVNRSGEADKAIRIYATGKGHTIEGMVDVILESADDRVRFNGYRLVGGINVAGEIANAEITLISCGIKTSGRVFPAAATHNLIACWEETDANPNVYTAVSDEVAQTATS